MKKLFIILCALALCSSSFAGTKDIIKVIARKNVSAGYTALDLTTFDESNDEGSDIAVQSATQVTWTTFRTKEDTGYVFKDMGAIFTGDFTIRFTFNITTHMTSQWVMMGGVYDRSTGDNDDLEGASANGGHFRFYSADGVNWTGRIERMTAGVKDGDTSSALALSTTYYITMNRATAQYTAYICTGAHYGEGGSSTVDTVTVAGPTTALRFVFALAGDDDGSNGNNSTGQVDDMEYKLSL